MKIVICTTPIRPVPTDAPPAASMALIQSLREHGYEPYFYDIDSKRPSFEQVLKFFREYKPDFVGISAVVSTAYEYTKKLSLALKEMYPDMPLAVGGNLAASAELLHRFCKVDICGIGEGDKVIINLARYVESHKGPLDREALGKIKGLTFLNEKGDMVFTGYEDLLPAEELKDPDYSIVEQYSTLSQFLTDPLEHPGFSRDPRTYESHRRGKKSGIVVSAKGCVARCTFCHRWDKGYRPLPVDKVIHKMKYLIDRYNVGFFCIGDENFGSDKNQVAEFIKEVKKLDVLYSLHGVRCRTVDLELLKTLRASGCSSIFYGMETGSTRILQVMEKNATCETNLNAARWTEEAGLYTVYQMILGMPGETSETVQETLDFIKKITEVRKERPSKLLSINYIQALPGTPVFEHARQKGLIGKTLEDEEKYLIEISDVNANDDTKFINFTEEDYFTVQSWRHKILFEAERHWLRVHNWKAPDYRLPDGSIPQGQDYYTQGGYFNLKKVVHSNFVFRYLYPLRPLYLAAYVVTKSFFRQPQRVFWRNVIDYFRVRIRKHVALEEYKSLRRIVKENTPPSLTLTEQSMQPLRDGR